MSKWDPVVLACCGSRTTGLWEENGSCVGLCGCHPPFPMHEFSSPTTGFTQSHQSGSTIAGHYLSEVLVAWDGTIEDLTAMVPALDDLYEMHPRSHVSNLMHSTKAGQHTAR